MPARLVVYCSECGEKYERLDDSGWEDRSAYERWSKYHEHSTNPSDKAVESGRQEIIDKFGAAYRKLNQPPNPSHAQVIVDEAAVEVYVDEVIAPLIATRERAAVEAFCKEMRLVYPGLYEEIDQALAHYGEHE